jgi:polysaccharide biosynthesis transport protein
LVRALSLCEGPVHEYPTSPIIIAGQIERLLMTLTIDASEVPAAVIDVRGLWDVLSRRKFWIIGIAGACLLISLCVALIIPPRFVSQTTVFVDPRGLQVLAEDPSPSGTPADVTFAALDSQVQILTSAEVLQKVIDELDLSNDPEFSTDGELNKNDPGVLPAQIGLQTWITLRALRKHIDVRRPDRTFIIDLLVWTSTSPAKSMNIANAIVRAYLKAQVSNQTEIANRTAIALEDRVGELRNKLIQAEREIENYRIGNNLVGGQGHFLDERELANLTNQLSLQRIRTSELLSRMEVLKKRNDKALPIDTIAEALQSPTLNDLRARYAEAKKAEADSLASLGPKHPAVITAQAQVAQVHDLIASELARIQQSLNTEYERSKSVENDLNQQIIAARKVSAADSPTIIRLRTLESDLASQRIVYEAMQRRSKEVREGAPIDRTIVRVISAATEQSATRIVSRGVIVLGGLAVGLIVGAFMAMFINQFDDTVTDANKLFARTRLFCLATVSGKAIVAESRTVNIDEPPETGDLDGVPEIVLTAAATRPGAILVLAATRASASAALTVALAKGIARQGVRPLVIDASRAGSITRQFHLEKRPGLADAMHSRLPLSWFDAKIGDVGIVPAGQTGNAKPGVLPASILAQLSSNNSVALVDGGALKDGHFQRLLNIASVVIVVIESGRTRNREITTSLKLINPAKTRLVASVFQT